MVYIHTDIQREETSNQSFLVWFSLSQSNGNAVRTKQSLGIKVLKNLYSIPSSWISGASAALISACHICRCAH